MKNKTNVDNLILCVLLTITGEVTRNIRAIFINCNDTGAIVRFYYETTPSDDEKYLESEVCGDILVEFFPEMQKVDNQSIILPYPAKINDKGIEIFRKYEGSWPVHKFVPNNSFNNQNPPNLGHILLSMHSTLLGCITNNIRKISVDDVDGTITVYFYYESDPTEFEKRVESVTIKSMLSQFKEIRNIKIESIILPYPGWIDNTHRMYFKRYELEPLFYIEAPFKTLRPELSLLTSSTCFGDISVQSVINGQMIITPPIFAEFINERAYLFQWRLEKAQIELLQVDIKDLLSHCQNIEQASCLVWRIRTFTPCAVECRCILDRVKNLECFHVREENRFFAIWEDPKMKLMIETKYHEKLSQDQNDNAWRYSRFRLDRLSKEFTNLKNGIQVKFPELDQEEYAQVSFIVTCMGQDESHTGNLNINLPLQNILEYAGVSL